MEKKKNTLKILTLKKKSNILLMGLPGSGKTTLGKILSKKLKMSWYDIDDHHLEKIWKMPVSEKLKNLGDLKFLLAEGKSLLSIKKKNTVISLTGSNPLEKEGMDFLKKNGIVIFLDAEKKNILKRLKIMKIDRIVGQNDNCIEDILIYRKGFYEKFYDFKIFIEENCDFEKVADELVKKFKDFDFFFESTRNENCLEKAKKGSNLINETGFELGIENGVRFDDVLLKGLADDGGLYLPKVFPEKLKLYEFSRLLDLTYQERLSNILERFYYPNEFTPQKLREIINKCFLEQDFENKNIIDVKKLNKDIFIMEMYNGPTASFKDLALQLTPKLINWSFQNKNKKKLKNSKNLKNKTKPNNTKLALLTATSGDTGIAAINGFSKENIVTITLFPNRGTSKIQKYQMITSNPKTNLVLQINNDFDFCQNLVKKFFKSKKFKKKVEKQGYYLTSGNSINWGRLLPQVFSSINGYLQMVKKGIIIRLYKTW